MENTNVKKENRKALPKFFLIIFVSAIFGGVMGFLSGVAGASSLPEAITAGVEHLLVVTTPWAIPVSSLALLGGGWVLYGKAKRLVQNWDGEDEDAMEEAEEQLSWALLLSSLARILDFFFLAAGSMGSDGTLRPLFVVAAFLISCAVLTLLQQKVVDLEKTMNPEKQGSVYDIKFQKKWFESCDEAEKAQIGQASCKAYQAGSMTCLVLWLVLVILDHVFAFGLVPIFVVLLIWAVLTVSYTLECIRLSKRAKNKR